MKNGSKFTKLVHVLVAEAFIGKKTGLDIDHLDNCKTNNRIDNLEYVTRRENISRGNLSDLKKKKSSKYRGVYFYKSRNKWVSHIMIGGKKKTFGYFDKEEDARDRSIEEVERYERAVSPEKNN